MKYCVIKEGDISVAIIFSDSLNGDFYIKSAIESLSIIFEAICKRNNMRLVRNGNKLIVKLNELISSVDAQVRSITDEICSSDRWQLGDANIVDNNDESINLVISKYIGWVSSVPKSSNT